VPTRLLQLLLCIALFAISPDAKAISTAASFDLSWGSANIAVDSITRASGTTSGTRNLTSYSVFQIDYNVALFDYKTVATLSFTQIGSSNFGSFPLTRIGLGASYHFVRVNGQRVILDSQVEGKIWGISPALEMSIGLTSLSMRQSGNPGFDFTASIIDIAPRLLIEVPFSPSVLIMFRAGLLKSISSGGGTYIVSYSGTVFNIGFKLTTL
jgi:hypothetical protein